MVAAGMARRRAVAVGDFMQLPAVVLSEHPLAEKWLGNHVFASARCDDAASEHPLRALLHEQWRMHPRISRLVSELFYAGRLRAKEWNSFPPLVHHPPGAWPASGVEWILLHRLGLDGFEEPEVELRDETGHVYVLLRSLRSGPLAGAHWFLYRKRE